MSFTFDTPLKNALDAAATQKAANDQLNALLTNTRTISLIKDGTAFYSATMSGPIRMERNAIADYGYVTATSVSQSADLTSGECKLRITGGGHYMEGSLGLTVAAQTAAGVVTPVVYDFMLSANPVAGNGVGFARRARTKLPAKPNGIGPAAPTLDANAPKRLEIYSVVNGVEALVDFLEFDTPDESMLFADAEIASQMGEVLVFKSSKSIIFDKFEFGAKLYAGNPSLTAVGNVPLYQVLCGAKPVNQGWDTYPASDTFNRATQYLHPPAFRAKLKRADGTPLYTWQGRDGTPINDPSWSQQWTDTQPLRPFWQAGMMLPWQNTRPRKSDFAAKYFSGITADSYRPSLAKLTFTVNGTEPFLDGYTNLDGYNHMYQMDKWPSYRGNYPSGPAQDLPLDPFMQSLASNGNHSYFEQVNGWGWEPGSKSGHEFHTGPGGVRFDRGVIPSLYALWATNQNFVRPKGNAPVQEMFDAHSFAFFNHPMFYLRDVKNFTGIPDDEIYKSLWNQGRAYYGGTFGKGANRTIDMAGVPAGGSTGANNYDAKGHLVWNGYLPDFLHGYHGPGWVALLTNSPIFGIAMKHRFNQQILSSLDDSSFPQNDPSSGFMTRMYAWRLLARALMWKLASGGSAGHDRFEIEEHLRLGLEAVYDRMYVPAFETPNQTDPYFLLLKNLGIGSERNGMRWEYSGGSLNYYLGEVLILMKQIGLWSVMRQKNYKCEKALGMLIYVLDKACYDLILDTPGTQEGLYGSGYYPVALAADNVQVVASDVPTSWADWNTRVYQDTRAFQTADPSQGTFRDPSPTADWVTRGDGTFPREGHESIHLRGQWGLNRPIYFPEYANPRMEAGAAKYQAYYDKVKNGLPAAADFSRTQKDFAYLTPSKGKRLPPSELGAE